MADTKISNLTSASSTDGTEVLPIVQSATTKKLAVSKIKDYLLGVANVFTQPQTFQPSIDGQAGTFRRYSGSQTAKVLEVQTEANATLASIDKDGLLAAPNATLALGTITTDKKILDLSATWNAAGVTFTGFKLNVTDTASAAGSLVADWQVGGVTLAALAKGGNFGLGTASPEALLHFKTSAWRKGVIETTGVTAKVYQGSDANGLNFTTNIYWDGSGWVQNDNTKACFAYIQHLANGRMEFRVAAAGAFTGWTTAAVITTAGRVGIGTLSPTNNLSLNGNNTQSFGMERHATADTAGNSLTVQSGGATSGATDKNGGNLILSSATSTGTGTSQIIFNTAAAGSAGTADNAPAERARISGAGNLLVGTPTDAGYRLDVSGTSRFVASVGSHTFGNTAAVFNSLLNDYDFRVAGDADANLLFVDASTDRVGIGTNAPGYKLEVSTSAAEIARFAGADYGYFDVVGAAGGSLRLQVYDKIPTVGSASNSAFRLISNNAERARFDASSGNLLLGGTTSPTTGTKSLSIFSGTAPTATAADSITVYSSDLSAGNTMLSVYTEGTSVSDSTDNAVTKKIAVRINGTVYYLLADTDAS